MQKVKFCPFLRGVGSLDEKMKKQTVGSGKDALIVDTKYEARIRTKRNYNNNTVVTNHFSSPLRD